MNDDLVELIDDDEHATTAPAGNASVAEAWNLLVVDDDDEVHQATRFALGDVQILGRSLHIHSVHSAAEAMDFLQQRPDIAVILLDVVMETEDAGLRLVGRIREELALDDPRIILRTGQPGYAPEVDVISRYDINDYRTKSELTHTRLLTSIIAALRGFDQIQQLHRSHAGLSRIIDLTNDLSSYEDVGTFAAQVLQHAAGLLGVAGADAALVLVPFERARNEDRFAQLVAASGALQSQVGASLNSIPAAQLPDLLRAALERGDSIIGDGDVALLCRGKRYGFCLWAQTGRPLQREEEKLLRVFAQYLAVSADKFALIHHLQRVAYEDGLTGLPNRLALLRILREALEQPAGRVLLLLDIDHFNSLNENIGYDNAEQLLKICAASLEQQARRLQARLARIGADIFALVGTAQAITLEQAEALTLLELDLDRIGDVKITLTGSLVPLDAGEFTTERLLSAGYAMLKEAKRDSIGHVLPYRPGLIDEVHENAILLQEMSHALPNNEFHLAYQPKWDLKRERFYGMEALIRWQRADGSWVSPAKFIPVAESSGLIVRIGQWVARTACTEYAQLLAVNPDPGPLALNVSGGQFRDEDFIPLLRECLERHDIRPDQVIIEITETAAINDGLEDAVMRLQAIRDMGMHVALDDFGTGYSSLSYLQQLPVDQLKIDRAFVQRLSDPEGSAIIGTMIQLSHALALNVVAEGAEEAAEVAQLAGLDCDVLQGYVYARPMPMKELIAWQDSPAACALAKPG